MQKVAARGIDDMHHAACHLQQLAARGIGAMQHAFGSKRHCCHAAYSIGSKRHLCHAACTTQQLAKEALVSCSMYHAATCTRSIGVMQQAACSHWPQEALVSCTMQPLAIGCKMHWCHAACCQCCRLHCCNAPSTICSFTLHATLIEGVQCS